MEKGTDSISDDYEGSLSPKEFNIRGLVRNCGPRKRSLILDKSTNALNEFTCPICFETIDEPYMGRCGHSFCRQCILRSLQIKKECPQCDYILNGESDIFPNFALNSVVNKQNCHMKSVSKRFKSIDGVSSVPSRLQDMFDLGLENWDSSDINTALEILMYKKNELDTESEDIKHEILKEFLQCSQKRKEESLAVVQQQLSLLQCDIECVETLLRRSSIAETKAESHVVPHYSGEGGFNGSKYGPQTRPSLAHRRQKLHQHFDDLESNYFNLRLPCPLTQPNDACQEAYLSQFSDCLSKLTRFSSVRTLASLVYNSDIYNNSSSIVSSIEFDKDNEFFGIAGVTKVIKVYEYATVIKDAVDLHYPSAEMVCNSKISCICWNSYHKSSIVSSDYEGSVTLWDAFTCQKVRQFQEHEKRCWSVDFNRVIPKVLASGSDDSKVKLWSTDKEHSCITLNAEANVCCVKFNPNSHYHMAFGSADHCVHYYDLRNPSKPLDVFKGHRKAVSYTKFLSSSELVSASTDSQLRLWNVDTGQCTRTFQGHNNEKHFVGLSCNVDYIVCGSENNSLYIYYKGLGKSLINTKLDTVKSLVDKEKREDDGLEFISAVCWRDKSNVIVAANSQGTIKIMELV